VFYRHFFSIPEESRKMLLQAIEELLSDPQLEVREQACQTLSGLLKLLESDTSLSLAEKFRQQATTPIPHRRLSVAAPPQTPEATDAMIKRHGGVLGVGAVVLSMPYDLPQWMPTLLLDCASHISDPMPIKVRRWRILLDAAQQRCAALDFAGDCEEDFHGVLEDALGHVGAGVQTAVHARPAERPDSAARVAFLLRLR
jgi:hypothetical protein